MHLWKTGVIAALVTFSATASAQTSEQDPMLIAQMHDRCMTTYAVRMTKTDATDEAIYRTASEGCRELEEKLFDALRDQRPDAEANEIIEMLESQSQPNFQVLLTQIRSDRVKRSAQ